MQNDRETEIPGRRDRADVADGSASSRVAGVEPSRAEGESWGTAGDGSELTTRAKETMRDLRHRAAEQVSERAEDRKERAAGSLGDVAQSLRAASNQLPSDDGVGRYMERAAVQVDNIAAFLESHEMADVVAEVEAFARRQPAVFVGGAFALGVLSARFLRSSRRNLGYPGPRGGWSTEELTERVDNPRLDTVSRPDAPGYVSPDQREPDRWRSGQL